MWSLAVVSGPWSGRTVPLGRAPAVIGRSAACALTLPDDDVSRSHAVVSTIGGWVTVADPGSTNGAYLDGVRVGVAPIVWPAGAMLRVGESTVLLERPGRTDGRDAVAHLRRRPRGHPLVMLGHALDGAPVVVDLATARLGVVGPDAATARLARWVRAQAGRDACVVTGRDGTPEPLRCAHVARVCTPGGTRMSLDGGPPFVVDGVDGSWFAEFRRRAA